MTWSSPRSTDREQGRPTQADRRGAAQGQAHACLDAPPHVLRQHMTFRWQWLRDSAREETVCSSCGGTFERGAICWAHSNQQTHGRGASHKAHDLMGAYVCLQCHDMIDGRVAGLTRSQKRAKFIEAWANSMVRLIERGIFDALRDRR